MELTRFFGMAVVSVLVTIALRLVYGWYQATGFPLFRSLMHQQTVNILRGLGYFRKDIPKEHLSEIRGIITHGSFYWYRFTRERTPYALQRRVNDVYQMAHIYRVGPNVKRQFQAEVMLHADLINVKLSGPTWEQIVDRVNVETKAVKEYAQSFDCLEDPYCVYEILKLCQGPSLFHWVRSFAKDFGKTPDVSTLFRVLSLYLDALSRAGTIGALFYFVILFYSTLEIGSGLIYVTLISASFGGLVYGIRLQYLIGARSLVEYLDFWVIIAGATSIFLGICSVAFLL